MESDSFLVGLVAQICVQKGAEEVNAFLENMKKQYGGVLPKGLKGARFVMMAWENQADDACLDPKFLEGLEALEKQASSGNSPASLEWHHTCLLVPLVKMYSKMVRFCRTLCTCI